MIRQCHPKAAYDAQSSDIDAAIQRVLRSDRYILGEEVAEFEREFAHYTGSQHALGVANGTNAITLSLKALGIQAGDIVITVSHSAVATTVAIRQAGASPLFIDVDEDNGLMDIERLAETLAAIRVDRDPIALDKIKAIVPVHLYGRCVDMESLLAIASEYGLAVVEDCAQAHGARISGRPAGSFGAFGCFSFYPTKNLAAIGDGGALVTSDPRLYEQALFRREYGWRERYISLVEGINSRLDELQAALLRVKLAALDHDNAARDAIANAYRSLIQHPAIRLPNPTPEGQHVYHQFAIRCTARDALRAHLYNQGISTLVHYPRAIHEQPAYAVRGYDPLPLPNTEAWARDELSLPMYPQLDMDSVKFVAEVVNAWSDPT